MFDRLGETLTVLRILQRLSQAELAAKAGIKATQVSRYETGQVLPQLPQLGRLLDALGVDLPAFLFALLHVERTVRLIEKAEHLPAETMIRDAVSAHWARVTDLHLSVAKAVATMTGAPRALSDAGAIVGSVPGCPRTCRNRLPARGIWLAGPANTQLRSASSRSV